MDSMIEEIPAAASEKSVAAAVEAMLFAAGSPVSEDRLRSILGISAEDMSIAVGVLDNKYKSGFSGLEIIKVDGALQLCTKREFAPFVKSVLELKKLPPLSKASLEVLAITAYNQPVTRIFIEQIRGIDSSSIVSSLCDKGLIRESGTLDAPGHPALFVTTDAFLRCFGLSSLEELPEPGEKPEDKNTQLTLDMNIVNQSHSEESKEPVTV